MYCASQLSHHHTTAFSSQEQKIQNSDFCLIFFSISDFDSPLVFIISHRHHIISSYTQTLNSHSIKIFFRSFPSLPYSTWLHTTPQNTSSLMLFISVLILKFYSTPLPFPYHNLLVHPFSTLFTVEFGWVDYFVNWIVWSVCTCCMQCYDSILYIDDDDAMHSLHYHRLSLKCHKIIRKDSAVYLLNGNISSLWRDFGKTMLEIWLFLYNVLRANWL